MHPPGVVHFLVGADVVSQAVLVLLAAGSVGSWYLIVAKALQHFILRARSRAFIAGLPRSPGIDVYRERLREAGAREPFARLLEAALAAAEPLRAAHGTVAAQAAEFLGTALARAIEEERNRLQRGQTFLATVASAAPFVGLFGTVWSIHHALLAIGTSGRATLEQIAGPVGEALLMTAFGLAVATPAAVAYNAFVRAERNLGAALRAFALDLYAVLAFGTGAHAPRTAADDVQAASGAAPALA